MCWFILLFVFYIIKNVFIFRYYFVIIRFAHRKRIYVNFKLYLKIECVIFNIATAQNNGTLFLNIACVLQFVVFPYIQAHSKKKSINLW